MPDQEMRWLLPGSAPNLLDDHTSLPGQTDKGKFPPLKSLKPSPSTTKAMSRERRTWTGKKEWTGSWSKTER